MDLGIRKRDLADKLQLLKRETASTVELVNLMLKSCETIVNEVCDTDRFIFLSQYPLVIKYLDERIHHALQFNCGTDNLISQDIKYEHEDRPSPRPRPLSITETTPPARKAAAACEGSTLQSPQQKLSEGPDLGVAVIKCQDESRPVPGSPLSVQPSSCVEVIADTPGPSQDVAVPVEEGVNKTGCQDLASESKARELTEEIVTVEKIYFVKKEKAEPLSEESWDDGADPIPPLVKKSGTRGTKVEWIPESVGRPVAVGDECQVMMSYIETPGEFYVHIACEENTTLDDFQAELNDFYNRNKVNLGSKAKAKPRMGNYCVCFHHPIGWCRAQILDWCLNEDHIELQLVDYGDICYAYLDVIQPMLTEYAKRPLYATRCHLAFIEPPPDNDTWPDESAKVFNCYMPPTNKTKLQDSASTRSDDIPRVYTIVKAEQEDVVYGTERVHQTSISVILRDDSDGEKLTMNDNLVDLGYAGSPAGVEAMLLQEDADPDAGLMKDKLNIVISDREKDVKDWVMNSLGPVEGVIKCEVDNGETFADWDPMREDFLDPSESREDAVLAVSGYNAQDEKRVCRFFARNGSCYKGANCHMEHSLAHRDGYTTDKELVYTHAYALLSMPAEESVTRVIVTHVPERRCYLYCVLPCENKISRPVFEEETLTTLRAHINEPRTARSLAHLKIPPARGQMVLAFSKQDSSWGRARVVEELDDNTNMIEVVFVDSGRTEEIHEKRLRAIEPSMLHLPFQAIECHLANIEVEDLPKASKYLHDKCLGKTLVARVTRSLEQVQVMYCYLSDVDGKDVGMAMVQAGLGYEKEPDSQLIMMPT